MKIALFTKHNNSDGLSHQEKFASFLHYQSIEALMLTDKNATTLDEAVKLIDELKMCAAMVVFGGDGSVLRAAALTSIAQIPILAVNLGNVGFLAELERDSTNEEILKAVKSYTVERRSMLEVSGDDTLQDDSFSYSALNDIVVKSEGQTPIYINAKVNGQLLDCYRADGVIVSTPTGSTAYALSAGGPIMSPEVNDQLIIPICPHTLHSRAAVVPMDAVVSLSVNSSDSKARLIVDGKTVLTIDKKMQLNIKKSKLFTTFLRGNSNDFYKRLLHKMNVWSASR